MTHIETIPVRTARKSDAQPLRELWYDAFMDTGTVTDAFFQTCFSPEYTCIAETGGDFCSAGYLIPYGELAKTPCAMIHAVATQKKFRSRGYAAAVTRALVDKARLLGFRAVIVCPASDGLFDFYARLGFRTAFYAREREFSKGELPPLSGAQPVKIVKPYEYLALRRRLLSGSSHVDLSLTAVVYQARLSAASGGELAVIQCPDGSDACCAVERDSGGLVRVRELITPPEHTGFALSAIAAEFDGCLYHVREPVARASDGAGVRRFGMVFGDFCAPDVWMGFAYD